MDGSIRLWKPDGSSPAGYVTAVVIDEVSSSDRHEGTINVLTALPSVGGFISASADRTVKLWKINATKKDEAAVQLMTSVRIEANYIPLALAAAPLDLTSGSVVFAVAGTKSTIEIYVAETLPESPSLSLRAVLLGHEGWIRSLAFVQEEDEGKPDLLLASASQDKYIRLWRIHQGDELPAAKTTGSSLKLSLGSFGSTLSNKAQRFQAGGLPYSATFEALLLGHEDWIYTVRWRRAKGDGLRLLSSSADNSLAIWQPDKVTGIWVCNARLGEISGQKGSTTATGSTGGFWVGLWAPDGTAVVSLGRSGGWRLWRHDQTADQWLQDIAVTGHVKAVTSIAWQENGRYLLSTR